MAFRVILHVAIWEVFDVVTGIKYREGHFIVPSSRRRVAPYSVRFSGPMGRYICNCPDWLNRRMKTGEDCKHCKAVRTFLDTASMRELEEALHDDENSN